MKILATDGGKHSDAKLAVAVAEHIVQVGATASGESLEDARRLQSQIADIMEAAFRRLADEEHAGIDDAGTAFLAASLAPHPDIQGHVVSAIVECIAASPFRTWFPPADTATMLWKVTGEYLGIAQHMHRDWFARHGKVGHGRELTDHPSHSPDCPHVRRWIAMHAGDTLARHEHAAALVEAA